MAGTFLPDVAERALGVEFRPWQRVYVQAAMLTHSVGMLGPYDDLWWWDHVTHTHTATVLGGLVHIVARRRDWDPGRTVLAAVLGGGVLWEVAEYAIHAVAERFDREPLLIPYGPQDTFYDLVFDVVGALLVVAFGDRALDGIDREKAE